MSNLSSPCVNCHFAQQASAQPFLRGLCCGRYQRPCGARRCLNSGLLASAGFTPKREPSRPLTDTSAPADASSDLRNSAVNNFLEIAPHFLLMPFPSSAVVTAAVLAGKSFRNAREEPCRPTSALRREARRWRAGKQRTDVG